VRPGLPPGAEPTRGSSGELRLPGRQVRESASIDVQPGIEIAPVHAPMRLGDLSQRLRVISTSFDGRRFVARLEGRRGRTYTLRASVPFRIESIVGGDARGSMSPAGDLVVTIPGDGDGWAPSELVITVGRRMPNASRGEQP
jgi:hypothetical protein